MDELEDVVSAVVRTDLRQRSERAQCTSNFIEREAELIGDGDIPQKLDRNRFLAGRAHFQQRTEFFQEKVLLFSGILPVEILGKDAVDAGRELVDVLSPGIAIDNVRTDNAQIQEHVLALVDESVEDLSRETGLSQSSGHGIIAGIPRIWNKRLQFRIYVFQHVLTLVIRYYRCVEAFQMVLFQQTHHGIVWAGGDDDLQPSGKLIQIPDQRADEGVASVPACRLVQCVDDYPAGLLEIHVFQGKSQQFFEKLILLEQFQINNALQRLKQSSPVSVQSGRQLECQTLNDGSCAEDRWHVPFDKLCRNDLFRLESS